MKYILEKDKKKRLSFRNSENRSLSLKFLSNFAKVKPLKNNAFVKYLVNKNIIFNQNNFSKNIAKNRCIFTNRSKSVYRFGRISRIKFRSYSSFGYMTGVVKSSW